MWNSFVVAATVVINVLQIVNGEIIQYQNHVVAPDRPEYLVIPKFDKGEVPHWYPGQGHSYIDLSQLVIRSGCNNKEPSKFPPVRGSDGEYCKDAVFDVLMFEAPTDKHWMNYWENGEYCCTDSVIEVDGCTRGQLNRLIVPDDLPGAFIRSVLVKTDESTNLFGENEISRHKIKKSGLYVLMMALCDPTAFPVVIKGEIESLDPYGYVAADEFGNMPFYLSLSLMYVAIGITWAILCFIHRDQLMPLQLWISSVLAIAMIETTLMYFHFVDWNESGVPTVFVTAIALLFGAVRRAISRVLVMLVSLGYGVVRPSLGDDLYRVLSLGSAYFVLSFIYSLMVNLSPTTKSVMDPDYDLVSLVVFLLALVDTTFYIWIFTSINNLLTTLASRRQGVKYLLYRNFRNVLLVMLFFTCAWVLYSSVLFLNDQGGANNNWRMKWTIDALWELIYFVIFVAIAILWAPSNNAQRYAYSIELTQLDDDSEFNAASADVDCALSADDPAEAELDDEYGGRLKDDADPFQGSGALDSATAIAKKA